MPQQDDLNPKHIKRIENDDPSCDLELIVERKGTMLGCWVPVKIYVNGKLITKLGNKKTVSFKVPHGKIEFTTEFQNKKISKVFTADEYAKPIYISTVIGYNKSSATVAHILNILDYNVPDRKTEVKQKAIFEKEVSDVRMQDPGDGHADAYADAYKWFKENKESILDKVGEDFVKARRGLDDLEDTVFEITSITGISKKMLTDDEALEIDDPDGEFAIEADMYQNGSITEFVDKADDNAAFLIILFGAEGFDEDLECAVINCYTKEIMYDTYCF